MGPRGAGRLSSHCDSAVWDSVCMWVVGKPGALEKRNNNSGVMVPKGCAPTLGMRVMGRQRGKEGASQKDPEDTGL